MIDAGLPLVQCLDILGSQEEDKNFAAVILQTRTDVESGASLADAMRKHPKTFDPLFTNMIAAGEAGGILDTILKRLATYIEKAVKLAGQVKSAMIYPIAVVVIAGAVVGVILWKVIPTFAALFSGLGADLPLPTRIVIALSDNLVRFFPFIFIGGGGSCSGSSQCYATRERPPRRRRDLLKAPILGNIMRKIAVARFCRTLSTLISSGVPILDGLEITAKTSGNAVVEDAIMETRKSIERGETISAPLKETRGLPADGGADDRRRRGDRRARHDAVEDCRVLRRGSRRRSRRAPDAAGATDDCHSRRGRRRHRHLDVPADLRPDQQADAGWQASRTIGQPPNLRRSSVAWLIAIRAVISTILLGSATFTRVTEPGSLAVDPFFFLIGLTYALTIVYALALRFVERHRWIVDLQLAIDAFLVTAFIYFTGGITSYFTSLYVLPVIAASTIQLRRGGLMVATLSTVLYVGLVVWRSTGRVGAASRIPGWSASRSRCRRDRWRGVRSR